VEWQDERKKQIFIISHFQDLLVREVAKRWSCSFELLHHLSVREVAQIMKGSDLRDLMEKRHSGFGFEFFEDIRELNTQETKEAWRIFGEEKITDTDRIQGVVVSRGREGIVRGKVRILLDPEKGETFEEGGILVAPMTSPDYIFVMKKAAAVITDAGGLTSHAAVVSRELHIPCIVGTRVATTFLKDGDMVEVDTTHGVVKKL
jgi:phosphohistidine swiveling domain-containing protein